MAEQPDLLQATTPLAGIHVSRSGASAEPPDALADQRSLLAAIVESCDDAILTTDFAGTVTSWNAGAERIYGYRAEEIVGRSASLLSPPERESEIPVLVSRLRGGERIIPFETIQVGRDEHRLHLSLTISPVRDGKGRLIAAATIARDVTKRRLEETRWRLLSEVGEALAWILDGERLLQDLARILVRDLADYCVTYLLEGDRIRRVGAAHVDPARTALVLRLDELALPSVSDAQGPGAVIRTGEPIVSSAVEPAFEKGEAAAEYLRILRTLAPVSNLFLPLRARGRTVGAVALARTSHSNRHYTEEDVALGRGLADRAAVALDNARLFGQARAELLRRETTDQELQRRYRQLHVLYRMTEAVGRAGAADEIFQQALDGLSQALDVDRASILLFDPDCIMRFKAWRGLSDGYRAAVEGHSPWTADSQDPLPIVVPDVAADSDLDDGLKQTILGEGIQAMAFIPLVFGGRLLGKFMLYFDTPRVLETEEIGMARTIAGTIAFAITRTRDQQSVRDAKEEAERASEAKSQFLGIMSHELRTPLNAVLGYAELLLLQTKGELTAGQKEQVERIQVSAHHQLELVEELLTYTRLEAGREEPRLITSDVRRVVSDVAELVRPESERKGLSLRVDIPDSPLPVVTDPAKLRQISLNLAENAIKYTDAGDVSIRLYRDDTHLCLDVRDTGPGIPADKLDYIFQPFARVDESRTRNTAGTGLGLAIARGTAALLGGEVHVRSQRGEGSTFSLRIRIQERL